MRKVSAKAKRKTTEKERVIRKINGLIRRAKDLAAQAKAEGLRDPFSCATDPQKAEK